jgi:hypothetical protein
VARAIPKIVEVPGGLSLGCQRESLYFPRLRDKKS